MAQQIQELINKIRSEGIDQAEKKARQVEEEAQKKANSVVEKAKKQAEEIIAQAKAEAKKTEKSTHLALRQASRDMILTLKEEINRSLLRILSREIQGSLTTEQLGEIIVSAAQAYFQKGTSKEGALVLLNNADLEKLKKGFIKKLQDQLKKSIEFQASENIEKGFVISFDKGKSSFDFTDESLVNYLSVCLSEELNALLKEAISS